MVIFLYNLYTNDKKCKKLFLAKMFRLYKKNDSFVIFHINDINSNFSIYSVHFCLDTTYLLS